MRRLFRAALGVLAGAASLVGMKATLRTAEVTVEQQSPATAPAPNSYDATEQLEVVKATAPKDAALIAFNRYRRSIQPPAWIGAPRSRHGRQYGPWGRA